MWTSHTFHFSGPQNFNNILSMSFLSTRSVKDGNLLVLVKFEFWLICSGFHSLWTSSWNLFYFLKQFFFFIFLTYSSGNFNNYHQISRPSAPPSCNFMQVFAQGQWQEGKNEKHMILVSVINIERKKKWRN